MAEPVEEAVEQHLARLPSRAASGSRAPRRSRRRRRRRRGRCARPDRGRRARRAPPCEAVPLGSSSGGSPTTNVRVMSAKQADSRSRGKRSITIGSPARIGPEPGSWPTAVCGPWETMNSSATRRGRVKTRAIARLDALAGERLAVEPSASPRLARGAACRAPRAIAASAARWARRMPAISASFFDAAPLVEERAVGHKLDAVRRAGGPRQRPGIARHGARVTPSSRHGAQGDLDERLVARRCPRRAGRRSRTPRARACRARCRRAAASRASDRDVRVAVPLDIDESSPIPPAPRAASRAT